MRLQLSLIDMLFILLVNLSLVFSKKNETPLFATVFVVLSTLHYYMFRPT
jgi:hypothetical protein